MATKSSKEIDAFAQAPLTALMPSVGSLETLKNLKSFIFARYEKIDSYRQTAISRNERVSEQTQAELDMLLEVLEFLKMSPSKEAR